MTDTPKTEASTSVTDWENRDVKGAALCCKLIHEQEQDKIKALREQQAAYVANLPKEPLDALNEINRVLADPRDLCEPEYGARAALTIINRLATGYALNDDVSLSEAIHWLSGIGLDSMDALQAGNQRSRAIAGQFSEHHQPFEA